VDQVLTSLEHRAHGTAYDVLGLSPTAGEANVRGAVSEQLAALRRWSALPDLPATLARRIEALRARTEEAGTLLADPTQRAALDVELGVLLPTDGDRERRAAFAGELRSRRARASGRQRTDSAVARSHLQLAKHYIRQKDDEDAHHLLRVSLLYDPYNLEARELCAACEARLPARPSTVRSDEGPPPPADYVEATPIARSPATARLHLAGAMMAAMLVTTIASAATVASLDSPSSSVSEPKAAVEAPAAADDQPSWVELLTPAFEAIESGDYDRALAFARGSQALQPSSRAAEAIAIASCATGDVERARASYLKLTSTGAMRRVASACKNHDIYLGPELRRVAALDLLPRAWKASSAGRMEEACNLANESMALWPNSQARLSLVVCACHRDDVGRARFLASLLAPDDWNAAAARCEAIGAPLGAMPQPTQVDEDFARLSRSVEEPSHESDRAEPVEALPPRESQDPAPVYIEQDISPVRLIRTPPAAPAGSRDTGDPAPHAEDSP
jgi:hypothetical protein